MLAATRSAEYVLLKETVPEKPRFLEVTSPKIHEDAVGLEGFGRLAQVECSKAVDVPDQWSCGQELTCFSSLGCFALEMLIEVWSGESRLS